MDKQLKRRSSHLTVVGNANDGKNDVIRKLDERERLMAERGIQQNIYVDSLVNRHNQSAHEGGIFVDAGVETYESEADALESLSQEGVQKASFDGVDFNETIKRLKERDLYYDSYADFMNSESKDGAYVEHDRETGKTTIYIKAETPQEAMDKLHEYGFMSKEECELFKSRFDDLEARGVDVSKIHGGDLSVLREDDLFEEFSKMALEAQENGKSINLYNRSEVEASMKQRSLEPNVSRETNVDGPDVQVGQSLSDSELLAKLQDAEINAGVSGPDVDVGKNDDLEMGD